MFNNKHIFFNAPFIRVLFAMMAMVLTMAFHSYEELPKSVKKKIDKTLEGLYPGKAIIKKAYDVNPEYREEMNALKIDAVFELTAGEKIIGFLVLARADSKFDEFDYSVIYDGQISIKNVKILAYRENQGGEIGSKRWLKQFIGKSSDDPIALYEDIQGISGATISCVSATEGVGVVTRFLEKVIISK